MHGYHSPDRKINRGLFQMKLRAVCQTNAHLLIQTLCEYHVWKMNYSTNKVQVSYTMIWERVHALHSAHNGLVTSIFFSCHNQISPLHKFRPLSDFGPFSWFFADLSRILWHFQKSCNPVNGGIFSLVIRRKTCSTFLLRLSTFSVISSQSI